MRIEVSANAKLNLFLDVRAKRPDGLHDLAAVNHEITLCDTLRFDFGGTGFRVHVEGNSLVPEDESNLVVKAARTLFGNQPLPNVEVTIRKRIPVGAGMGGGSADAAATLKALSDHFGLGLDNDRLIAVASKVGADVPFSLVGGTALIYGAGEVIRPVSPPPKPLWFLVVDPGVSVNTGQAYGWLDAAGLLQPHDPDEIVEALSCGDPARISKGLRNSFEQVVFSHHPEIGRVRDGLLKAGAMGALMTGSGSNVFALVSSEEEGEKVLRGLTAEHRSAWVVRSAQS